MELASYTLAGHFSRYLENGRHLRFFSYGYYFVLITRNLGNGTYVFLRFVLKLMKIILQVDLALKCLVNLAKIDFG